MSRRLVLLGIVLAVALGSAACSSDTDDGAASGFPLQNPSAAEVEEATGLVFPDGMTEYRSVNVGDDALYLSFSMPVEQVTGFATGSGLTLDGATRLLAHPSPLWPEGDPAGRSARSAERTSDGFATKVEVWTDATDVALVRVGISAR
jgi:hypothetical protein